MKTLASTLTITLLLLSAFACNATSGTQTSATPISDEAIQPQVVAGYIPPSPFETWSEEAIQPQVVAGGHHSCLLRRDGSVICWGSDEYRQSSPPLYQRFVQIGAGGFHTCGLGEDGRAICWGDDEFGQSSPPLYQRFVQVSPGLYHTCGLREDGRAICWGDDKAGQSSPPAQNFVQASAGAQYTCGLKEDGRAVCWGNDEFGQSSPPEQNFVQISAGFSHTCGLREDGRAICWGRDEHGQSSPPAQNFIQTSAGGNHTCGLREDGRAICWGNDEFGQSSPPEQNFVQTSEGWGHTCGLREDGRAICWGSNAYGQSSLSPTSTPTPFATSTPYPTYTPVPRVPRSVDHPDVRGDVSAANAAAKEGFKQICRTAETIQDGDYYPGVGTLEDYVQIRIDNQEELSAEYENIGESVWRFYYPRNWAWRCIVLSSNVQAKLVYTYGDTIIPLSPGRNVVRGRNEARFDIYVRCNEGKCDEDIANQTGWNISFYRIINYSGDYIRGRWKVQEEEKTGQLVEVLNEIRNNWLDWQDRVDRGHPVFDIEVDDLNRQCERAKIITDELDTLGKIEYREWFDVCDDG